jgi:two-component system, LytTR family, response regulator LytT
VGYLLKPYTESQINKALDKCRMLKSSHKKSYNSEIISTVKTVLKSASHFEYKKRLIIKLPSGLYILPVENISFIQAKEALLFAFDFSGKKYPLTGTLMQIYQQLNPDAFFKINRGTVINVEAIEKIENETSDRLSISLKGQKGNFTISSSIIPEFRKWVNS